jgi:D-alanyl-D-alanine carboxypeptidase
MHDEGTVAVSADDASHATEQQQTQTQQLQQQLQQQIEEIVALALPDATGPGIAYLVARGDDVISRGARGLASVEFNVPLSPDHVFRIGSVTKVFTAVALQTLMDGGAANLDNSLDKYLPAYP